MDKLLDTAPCGFLSIRDDGSITAVNRTLLAWLGYTFDELQGRRLDNVLPASSRIFYQTHVFPLLRIHGQVEEVYFPLRRKDGTSIPMLVNAARRAGEDAYDCVFMSMSQRDQYENEILRAKAMAEDARVAKEQAYADLEAFAYSVSHDLRTPLGTIRMLAESVLKEHAGKLDLEIREYLGIIVESAQELSKMTDDILAYSRTSASALEFGPVSLEKVVARAVDHLHAELARRDAQLNIVRPLPAVRGHPTLLQQVVVNLLANAVKFVAPGVRPEVRIRAERCSTPEPRVRLWIEDNGIGVAPDGQERIFHLFERGDAGDEYTGTGIGLAIVRKSAERMGGSVGLESTPGAGSRFWVELPPPGNTNADTH